MQNSENRAQGTFRVTCRHCEREAVRDVAYITEREVGALRDHLAACCPSLTPADVALLGELLRHFTLHAG